MSKLNHHYLDSSSRCIAVSCTKVAQTSARPYMNQTMPIASVNLISFFIIEKGSYVFQCLCDSVSHQVRAILVPWGAITTIAPINFNIAIARIYFSQALPGQDIADIYGTSCIILKTVRKRENATALDKVYLMQIIATPDIPNMAKSQQEQYTPLGFCVKIRKHPQHCLQVSVHNFAFQLVNGQIATGLVRLVDKWPAFKHPLYKRQTSTGTLILHLLNVSNISQANLPKVFHMAKLKYIPFVKRNTR